MAGRASSTPPDHLHADRRGYSLDFFISEGRIEWKAHELLMSRLGVRIIASEIMVEWAIDRALRINAARLECLDHALGIRDAQEIAVADRTRANQFFVHQRK